MTWNEWLREYKRVSGLRSVAGNVVILKEDFADGYTPQQSFEYNKRGYGPRFMQLAATAEKWQRLVGATS